MSYVDELIEVYRGAVSLSWQNSPAPGQRIWMAIYPPEQERRLRLNLPAFREATAQSDRTWRQVEMTDYFERWLAGHDYRDAYFAEPELLETALPDFLDWAGIELRDELDAAGERGVVGLLGVGSLFGLGEEVKVSALLNAVSDSIRGRLLVFFPGEREGDTYRLLDARDSWNYLAIPLTAGGHR